MEYICQSRAWNLSYYVFQWFSIVWDNWQLNLVKYNSRIYAVLMKDARHLLFHRSTELFLVMLHESVMSDLTNSPPRKCRLSWHLPSTRPAWAGEGPQSWHRWPPGLSRACRGPTLRPSSCHQRSRWWAGGEELKQWNLLRYYKKSLEFNVSWSSWL